MAHDIEHIKKLAGILNEQDPRADMRSARSQRAMRDAGVEPGKSLDYERSQQDDTKNLNQMIDSAISALEKGYESRALQILQRVKSVI